MSSMASRRCYRLLEDQAHRLFYVVSCGFTKRVPFIYTSSNNSTHENSDPMQRIVKIQIKFNYALHKHRVPEKKGISNILVFYIVCRASPEAANSFCVLIHCWCATLPLFYVTSTTCFDLTRSSGGYF
jgi:hypothetical protein